MKYLAKLKPCLNAPIISIWQVHYKREIDPLAWEGRELYSLVSHAPLIARFPKKTQWHFAFKAGGAGDRKHASGGEGIAHLLSKLVIYEHKKLSVELYGDVCDLIFDSVEMEWGFVSSGRRKYFIDLVATLSQSHTLPFGNCDRIGIEVKDQHEVSLVKQSAFQELAFPVIQIYVPPWLHVSHAEKLFPKDLGLLRWKLKKNFSNVVKCKVLENPLFHKKNGSETAE